MAMERLKVRVIRKFVQLEGDKLTAVLQAVRLEDKDGDARPQSIVIQYHRSAFDSNTGALSETAERLLLLPEESDVTVSTVYEGQPRVGLTRHLYQLTEILTPPGSTASKGTK